ncbi:hypothetical protein BDP27DRAFT_1361851 [Rhodocollybia butyracea]|uniref:Uncharacterized protein n=1 Tax=Rhodocollybia butyracea TaxID=206335 RepID=A0A9P5Q083_9AGAR|nr:hypothetical protein BDP27DRAFT_1361851 [Rhodocollybia butyracea]
MTIHVGKAIELTPGAVTKILSPNMTCALLFLIRRLTFGLPIELKDYAKILVAELPKSATETEASSLSESEIFASPPTIVTLEYHHFVHEIENRKVNGKWRHNNHRGTFVQGERAHGERDENNDPTPGRFYPAVAPTKVAVLTFIKSAFRLVERSRFQLKVGDESFPDLANAKKHMLEGGMEWKAGLCLLVAVTKDTADIGTAI